MRAQKPGRPELVATAALRRMVSARAGGGMAHEDIALGLGISRTTLLKHFRHELTVGALKARGEVLDALLKMARKGHVAAAKAYLAVEPHLAASAAPKSPPPAPVEPVAEKTKPLGVKEQAKIEADKATTDDKEWGDVLPNIRRVK